MVKWLELHFYSAHVFYPSAPGSPTGIYCCFQTAKRFLENVVRSVSVVLINRAPIQSFQPSFHPLFEYFNENIHLLTVVIVETLPIIYSVFSLSVFLLSAEFCLTGIFPNRQSPTSYLHLKKCSK